MSFVTPVWPLPMALHVVGLRNAPATFPRIVVKLHRSLYDFTGAYLDDNIIFSQSWRAHADHLRTVPTRFRDAHLTLSPTKCQFAAADLDYLGYHIGLGRVQPRHKKVGALLAYQVPQSKKQLQSFLGLSGYYRKFVPNYSHGLKKGSRFVWTKEADAAFLDLKSCLVTRPVLRPPDNRLPFCLSWTPQTWPSAPMCSRWLMCWNIPSASTARSWMPIRNVTPPSTRGAFPCPRCSLF